MQSTKFVHGQAMCQRRYRDCSSGSGGGMKGPSTVDKRLQEQKCPYCERVFKQVSFSIVAELQKLGCGFAASRAAAAIASRHGRCSTRRSDHKLPRCPQRCKDYIDDRIQC